MGESSTTERLELHNESLLLKSAGEKIKQGKQLTQAEIRAVANAERRAKITPASPATAAKIIESVMALVNGDEVTADTLRTLFGTVVLNSQTDIADAFDQSINTIRQSWRMNKMPGTPGEYDVAAILAWKLNRDRKNRDTASNQRDDLSQKLKELEVRNEEASASLREIKLNHVSGAMIDRRVAQAEVAAVVVTAREQIMGIGRRVEPLVPREHAPLIVEIVDGECARTCTQISETDIVDLVRRRDASLKEVSPVKEQSE